MPDNQITKIYELKTVGGQETYNQLDRINAMFKEMAKNKASLGTINITNNIDSSAFDKLIASNKELIVGMKTLTGEMGKLGQVGQQMTTALTAAMGKTNMAAMDNIVGFSKLTAAIDVNGRTIIDYNRSLAQLGERLSALKQLSTATSQSLKILGDEYRENAISEQTYTAESARLTTELQQTKTQITEVSAAMTALNKVYNPGLLEEENAELAMNRAQLQRRTQMLKAEAVANDAMAGSVRGARAEIALLNREQEDLVVVRKEGVTISDEEIAANIRRRDTIIAEKDALHAFVLENADSNLARVLNIGNYPKLSEEYDKLKVKMEEVTAAGGAQTEEFKAMEAEALRLAEAIKAASSTGGGSSFVNTTTTSSQLSQLKVNMQGLVEAGKQDSAEFREMQLEAQRLTAVLQETNIAIKGATTVGDKFSSIVERMGLRMIANLIIFQAAIEVGQKIWEAWTKDAKAAEELANKIRELDVEMGSSAVKENAHAQVLLSIAQDSKEAMNIRIRAVNELQQTYPDYLGNLSQEALLTGNVATEMERLNQALMNKALMEAAEQKIQEYAKQYLKMQEDLLSVESRRTALAGDPLSPATPASMQMIRQGDEHIAKIKEQMEAVKQQMNNYLNMAKDFASKAAGLVVAPGKKPGSKEHDYTKAELDAEKKLNDEIFKLLENRLTYEMNEQREVFENSSRTLQQRLSAYSIYAQDMKHLIQLQSQAEINDVQSKLNKISEIETAVSNKKAGGNYDHSFFDKGGNLRSEENNLLLNKDALTKQLDVVLSSLGLKMQQANTTINRDIASITSSGVNKMLQEISNDASRVINEIEAKANAARGRIYGSKESDKLKDKHVLKIGDQESVSKDRANIDENQKQQAALELMIKEESAQAKHNSAMEQLENQHIEKLQELRKRATELQTQLQTDAHKQSQDNEADNKIFLNTMKDESITAFNEIGTAYVQMLAQQDAINEKHAQTQLEWTKKLMDSQVQSNQQMQTEEKEAYIQEQALDRQKMMEQRRLAEAQMAIDYATAVMKIVAANADDFEIAGAIEIAGISAVYAAKLAMMQSVQYGQGGDVPSNGGVFGGKSHSRGGTPFLFSGGRFEAEAGELAIINKKSAGSNTNMTVTGTPKQIASAVNAHGGGYNFAPGAKMYKFEYGGSLGGNITPPSFVSDYYTHQASSNGNNTALLERLAANHDVLMKHVQATNDRIDRMKVSLDHREVSKAQDAYKKRVQINKL